MRERHYLVLPQLGLAYCRVPKAANSSVRYLLARRFGFKAPEAEPNLVPNKDRFWTGQPPGVAHCLTPADFALLQAGADRPWCFSIVRNPFSWAVSQFFFNVEQRCFSLLLHTAKPACKYRAQLLEVNPKHCFQYLQKYM